MTSPDVRHDHDRVGAQQIVDGFDDVDAGLLEIDRHAPHFGVAIIGQQLAPRRDDLIGIEQRHLRKRVGVEDHALCDFRLVVDARGGPRDSRGWPASARIAAAVAAGRASSPRSARARCAPARRWLRPCRIDADRRALRRTQTDRGPCRRGSRAARCAGRSGRNSARRAS